MSVSSISDLSRQRMLSMFNGSQTQQLGQTTTGTTSAKSAATPTTGSSSPFAQMLADLQDLEKASPKQYSKVTSQISSDFTAASSQAQSSGNTSLAAQFSALSNDFSKASTASASAGSHFNPLQFMGGLMTKFAGL